jgi:Helicase associated domain
MDTANTDADEAAVTDMELAEAASALAAAAMDGVAGFDNTNSQMMGGRITTNTTTAFAAGAGAGTMEVPIALLSTKAGGVPTSDDDNNKKKKNKRKIEVDVSSTSHKSSNKRETRSKKGSDVVEESKTSFNDFIYLLVKFQMENGHCRVPFQKGGQLGKWVSRIRQEYKKIKPTLDSNIAKENPRHDIATTCASTASDAASPTGTPTTADNAYMDRFSNGVGTTNASTQAVHDSLRLDQERLAVLTHLGMVWDKLDNHQRAEDEHSETDHDESWNGLYQALIQYKEKTGHCNVPQKGYGKLSRWVKVQREAYQNTVCDSSKWKDGEKPRLIISADRIKLLEKIGFEWRVRPPTKSWDERYAELVEYKNTFGNCNVPQVRMWCEMTKGTFTLTLLVRHVADNILIDDSFFFQTNTNTNTYQNYPANRILGKWTMKQRGF